MTAGGEATVVTLAPFAEHGGVEVAPLGLSNMVNVGGAVLDFQLKSERGADSNGGQPSKGVLAHLVVKGIGQLLVASTAAPRRVLVDGVPGVYAYDAAAGSTVVQLPAGPNLTRDVSLSY